jgi:nitroimidazol reductase NimA-like FMN-containing flavoprotein (pyridoxamine 5'-phosphate oxidase superfamily)
VPADPVAELLQLPKEYGRAEVPLAWGDVRARLAEALHYWLATVRPDGRPHVVPLDGIWLNDSWYFGGSSEAVKHSNLKANPRAALHLEDAQRAVIVEGVCEEIFPDGPLADQLSALSTAKYGYGPDPASYTERGVWCLRPQRALSWERLPRDATRFVFRPRRPTDNS